MYHCNNVWSCPCTDDCIVHMHSFVLLGVCVCVMCCVSVFCVFAVFSVSNLFDVFCFLCVSFCEVCDVSFVFSVLCSVFYICVPCCAWWGYSDPSDPLVNLPPWISIFTVSHSGSTLLPGWTAIMRSSTNLLKLECHENASEAIKKGTRNRLRAWLSYCLCYLLTMVATVVNHSW